jgi:hypothetical protein
MGRGKHCGTRWGSGNGSRPPERMASWQSAKEGSSLRYVGENRQFDMGCANVLSQRSEVVVSQGGFSLGRVLDCLHELGNPQTLQTHPKNTHQTNRERK